MLSIAGFAVAYLLDTLSPLLDAWALHRSTGAAQTVSIITAAGTGLVAVMFALAMISFLVWVAKARANVNALFRGTAQRPRGLLGVLDRLAGAVWFIPVTNLVLPPLQIADLAAASVGRSRGTGARRRISILVWVWWTTLLTALCAAGLGLLAGADNAQELAGIRSAMATGEPVEVPLAVDLLGHQVAQRLPSASLFVVAAALALLLVARVTNAQYAKVARLRGPAMAPTRSALRAAADDWTVVLPAGALVDLLSDEAGERTTVLPAVALGGTIGA
jgi:hypothetical protein